MELLDGMNLDVLVKSFGRVPANRVIHIVRQVCESLEEAHARGLVHRDIKPANIHIGRLGLELDFVKVLDFGLVKTMTGTTGEHSMATGMGMTPGTPDYMSPEMLLAETVDARTDIYAVGCVAYFLLTGLAVFDGPSVFAVMAKHMNEEPIPPSLRAGIEVPRGLEALILACLAKKGADRPASAAELGRALAAVPTEPWTQELAAQWWSTHQPYSKPA
jgi:serine/threonine protein kinase